MPDFIYTLDFASGALPLLIIIAGLFLVKKLLRLGLFIALIAGAVLVLENEGISVVSYIQEAFSKLQIDALLDWFTNGKLL